MVNAMAKAPHIIIIRQILPILIGIDISKA
jgi:hypothetical protein